MATGKSAGDEPRGSDRASSAGTKRGAYYIQNEQVLPLKRGTEFLEIIDIIPFGERAVLMHARGVGYFRIEASKG